MLRFPFAPLFSPRKKKTPLDVSPGVQPDAISRNAAMKAVEHHWPMALELLAGFPVTAAAWKKAAILGSTYGSYYRWTYVVYLGLLWFNYGSYWVNYDLSWLTFFLGGDNYSECRFCRFITKDNPASRVTMFFGGQRWRHRWLGP